LIPAFGVRPVKLLKLIENFRLKIGLD